MYYVITMNNQFLTATTDKALAEGIASEIGGWVYEEQTL